MPLEDLSDPNRLLRKMKKDVKRTPVHESGDGWHRGSGYASTQVGEAANATGTQSAAFGTSATATGAFGPVAFGADAEASGDRSTAVGTGAVASGSSAVAVGIGSFASGTYSMAIGRQADCQYDNSIAFGRNVTCNSTFQIKIGTSGHVVEVDGDLTVGGTFSNPSARRLKKDITVAPDLVDIFPDLVEYEYIVKPGRRLGYIADDLVGTDAERFVTFDNDGQVAGIDYLSLLIVQNARLNARVAELERKVG